MKNDQLTHETLTQQVITLVREQVTKFKNRPSDFPNLGLEAKHLKFLFNDPAKIPDEVLSSIIAQLRPPSKYVTVNTANSESVEKYNREAQQNSRMICILGYPGAGKSDAHDYYRMHNINSFKVEVTISMKRREFLKEILLQLGVYFDGTLYEMVGAIAHELNGMNKPLLIIDEVSKLNHNSLMDLHDLRNRTMGIAGIVLSGCEYFHKNLLKDSNRNKQGIPEFYSRVQGWYYLEPITKAEIKAICVANGVTDEATIKEFQKAKNFRELYNVIINERDTQKTAI